ncbi:MAG: PilZ domain-containing protein [Anaerolineales bacterium]|nr:PilZ domain-containing protein [Anaerolineales bacterium]
MTIPETIFTGLQRLQRANRPLDLLNLFKGVPIVYPAFVAGLDLETVTVRVPSFEVICLTLETTTILLSQLLEEAVSAQVLSVDLALNQATLGQLQYASQHVGDRMTVRVAPRQPIRVQLECGGTALRGELTDVSINGLGLHVPAGQAGALRPRAVVSLSLPLPQPVTSALELSGTVRFVRVEGGLARVGITFAQDVQMLSILPYVRERQNEILAELKDLHDARPAPA